MKVEREQFENLREQVEEALTNCIKGDTALESAMRYSLLSGGKRIRPVMTLAFCEACGGETSHASAFACAVECVHAYSLIHDDLPGMDNDALRRGKPTNHIVYGEGMAILAGDSLLTYAFELIAAAKLPDKAKVSAAAVLAGYAGKNGMAGGQALDIANIDDKPDGRLLNEINSLKTGALLCAAAQLGCLAAGAQQKQINAAVDYAKNIGLAFQIRDDIMDAQGDPKITGKAAGSDKKLGKTTYFTLYGRERCEDEIQRLTDGAREAAANFEKNDFLIYLAEMLAGRNF